ncbi:DnaT-like ssDNA-binding protein [Xanthobacteraceae bacterium A53D]
MSLVVEDGTGIAAADSYVSSADLLDYAGRFSGATLPTDEAALERPLRVASAWVDATYRARFRGQRLRGRQQGLEWPRSDAFDAAGSEVPETEVPREIRDATCEAALREVAKPGSLSPDLKRGGAIKSVTAGEVEVVFADRAPLSTTFATIEGWLSGLLLPKPGTTSATTLVRF